MPGQRQSPRRIARAQDELARLNTWRAHAHGTDFISYFQFRQAVSGPETFHSALVPHAGAGTALFQAVAELGRELDDGPLADIAPGTSRVFFVHDWESWRAAVAGGRVTSALDPIAQNEAYCLPFFRAGERADIGPSALLNSAAAEDGAEAKGRTLRSRYDLVVLSSQFLVRAELTPALEQVVRDGGQLLIGPHSGVVDQDVRCPPRR